MIKLAFKIAMQAHRGQRDKSGHPYINHPIAVAVKLSGRDEKVVALLHDVVEDTNITLDHLRMQNFPPHIIDAVDAITKREGEKYFDYIDRVKANDLATSVKKADIAHNSDPNRQFPGSEGLAKRYARALEILS